MTEDIYQKGESMILGTILSNSRLLASTRGTLPHTGILEFLSLGAYSILQVFFISPILLNIYISDKV